MENNAIDNAIMRDNFTGSFTSLKIRYKDLDDYLTSSQNYEMNDKVNVFLNFESIMKHITMILNLQEKIMVQKEFEKIIISNTINYIAHYKRFFVNNTFDTRVYLYMTDLDSDNFHERNYNEDFRSYYLMKYNSNPKFTLLANKLRHDIIKEVKTLCNFIPNAYFIVSKNIDSSLVPLIIGNESKDRKNVIISSDPYEMQYTFIDGYDDYYIKRNPTEIRTISGKEGFINVYNKTEVNTCDLARFYDTYPLFCSLLSSYGDKKRSIDNLSGVGIVSLSKLIESGVSSNVIQKSSSTPEVLGDIFHDTDLKDEFINNFYCTSFLNMYKELTQADKSSITNQIIDRRDDNAFTTLNRTTFANYPLIIEGLLI